MRRWQTRKSERGFSLPELLVLIALITLVSFWGLPRALAPRLRLNETAAVELLRMLGSSREAWEQRTGVSVPLAQLANFLFEPGMTELPRALMPRGFVVGIDGVVLRGGYRFREVVDSVRGPQGCWAWPKLPGYSGRRVYWLDYGNGQVWIAAPEIGLPPPLAAPEAGLLTPG